MEEFPLNKAHQEYRRAIVFEKKNDIESAITSHNTALTLLTEVLTQSRSRIVRESILLQIKYHNNRIIFIKCCERNRNMSSGALQVGSVGSSGSTASTWVAREASPQPHIAMTHLYTEIRRLEYKNQEFLDTLQNICTKNIGSSTNSIISSNSSNKLQSNDNGDQSQVKDDQTSDLNQVVQKLSINEDQNNEVKSIIDSMRNVQKEHTHLGDLILEEMDKIKGENIQLTSKVRDLRGQCRAAEKEIAKLRELTMSPLRCPSSPCAELPPLDLPPFSIEDC